MMDTAFVHYFGLYVGSIGRNVGWLLLLVAAGCEWRAHRRWPQRLMVTAAALLLAIDVGNCLAFDPNFGLWALLPEPRETAFRLRWFLWALELAVPLSLVAFGLGFYWSRARPTPVAPEVPPAI